MAADEDLAAIRERLVAHQRDPGIPLGDVVERIERLTTAPGFADLDAGARAYVWTLGAAAVALRSRTDEADQDDLDRGIDWTSAAAKAWPTDDPNLARTRVNLATLLTERYERDGDIDDLVEASGLFSNGIRLLRAQEDRLDVALHSWGLHWHLRAGAPGARPTDLDRAVAAYREALQQAEPDAQERAGYLNSLGLALRAKGRASADPELLAEAAETYEQARAIGAVGSEPYLSASVNLAVVLQDRAEADNDARLLDRAVEQYRSVLPLLPDNDPGLQLKVNTNLAVALIDVYRHRRDIRLLRAATAELRANAARAPEGAVRDEVQSNLAAALLELADYTGRLAFLDEAIAVEEELLSRPTPERLINLGVALIARYRRRGSRADLDRAIAVLERGAATTDSAIERASAHNSEANAMSFRYDESADLADLEECIQLRTRAMSEAPTGSLDRALYEGNLGVELAKRYDSTADVSDLTAAIEHQRAAAGAVPPNWSDQPRLLAGLADSLARQATRTGQAADRQAVTTAYQTAVDSARRSLPEQALGAAMRWGHWATEQRTWTEATAAYEAGLTALANLVLGQSLRGDKESWLRDARDLPAAAGFAAVRSGDLRSAVTMLEHGRAMLLADALARPARIGAVTRPA
jgi:tetratricopeptide (TPR) repeat protein